MIAAYLIVSFFILGLMVWRYKIPGWIMLLCQVLSFGFLYLFLFKPDRNNNPEKTWIVLSNQSTTDQKSKLKTEYKDARLLSEKEFLKTDKQSLNGVELKVLGANFSDNFWAQVSPLNPSFIQDSKNFHVLDLDYLPVLGSYDFQKISCTVYTEKPTFLKLYLQDFQIDSIQLKGGLNYIESSFPVFSSGKTQLSLGSEKWKIPLYFYVKPEAPKHILIYSESPNMETKILADFLRNKGHKVSQKSLLGEDSQIQVSDSQAMENSDFDLIISTSVKLPSSYIKPRTKLFFMGLEDLNGNLSAINSKWKKSFVLKNTLQGEKKIFALKALQRTSQNNQMASEGHIGLSVMEDTFPLKLAGDSLTYMKIWSELMYLMQPSDSLWIPENEFGIYKIKEGNLGILQTGWNKTWDSVWVHHQDKPFSWNQERKLIHSYIRNKLGNKASAALNKKPVLDPLIALLLFVILQSTVWFIQKRQFS
jgi:hypothetical protein